MNILSNFLYRTYGVVVSITAIPIALIFIIFGKISIMFNAYCDVSILVSRIPFLFGQKVRYFYYKYTLKQLGNKVIFKFGTFCQYNSAVIGSRVQFGYFNTIGEVKMGNDIVIGGFVNFISGKNQHSYDDITKPIIQQNAIGRQVINIGSDIWIGSNSVITSDLGNRCVIGAGSVVVKPAENYSIYAGNPAKLIRKIN